MQADLTRMDTTGLISISHYREIREWCSRLSCTEIELAEAIAVVGYSPELVRLFLANGELRPSSA